MRSRITRRADAMTAVQAVGPLVRIAAAKPAALLESNGDTNGEGRKTAREAVNLNDVLTVIPRRTRPSSLCGRLPVDARVRKRFRDGDADAVRAVYRAYASLVYAVAYKVLADRGLCEEATQQTFLKAWRAAGSIDPDRQLGPWLATIAGRVAIDVYRREAHRAVSPLEAIAPDDPALVSPPMAIEDMYHVWEVRRAVCALPEEEREVVRHQHFDGLTHAQIATQLGVPVGTVKSRSFRAHRRLASELGHLREENQSAVDDLDK